MAKEWSLCVLVTLYLTASQGDGSCIYPDFVQNDPNDILDYWAGHVQYGVPHQKIVITNDTATVHVLPSQEISINGTCVEQVGNASDAKFINRVTVHKNSTSSVTLYVCTQIIKRTPDLLQLRIGPYNKTSSASLCDDAGMVLHSNLVEAVSQRDLSWNFCNFNGGYFFDAESGVWNSTELQPLCPQLKGIFPSRAEGECLKGEGIEFTFPLPECIPDKTGWSQFQTLQCKGNWISGAFSYSVLQSSEETYCMRYPNDYQTKTGNFTAYIYQYLTCPAEDPPMGTPYIKLTMEKVDSTVCEDYAHNSICQAIKQLCNMNIGQYCRKTCGLCSSTKLPTQGFHKSLQGNWVEVLGDLSIRDISITNETYVDKEFGAFVVKDTLDSMTYVLQTAPSDNGCLPRYLCGTFNRKTSPVLSYKFSQSVLSYSNKYYVCLPNNFRDDPAPLGETYRSTYMKNLISAAPSLQQNKTLCGLGGNYTINLTIPSSAVFPEKTECFGTLSDSRNCVNQTSITMQVFCQYEPFVSEFDCLASWDSYETARKFKYLLTVSPSGTNITLASCWVMPEGSNTMYIVGSGQCNEATLLRIQAEKLQPFGIITGEKLPDNCTDNTTPGPMPTISPTQPSSGLSGGQVAGIVIGCLVAVALAVVIAFFVRRRMLARRPYENVT